MPQYEQKDNDGVLFANKNRESDGHPHAKGSAMIDGVEYWVAAWTNTSKKGEKYQKLAFTKKDEQPAAPQDAPPPVGDDEEIPW